MNKEYIVQGKTVEEAIEKALEELNLERDSITPEILEMPQKGLFGKIKVEAKVKIIYDDGKAEEKELKKAPKKEEKKQQKKENREIPICDPIIIEKKVAAGKKYIEDVVAAMGIGDITVNITKNDEGTTLMIDGENLGALIGRRGETIDAIQYLVSLVCNKVDNSFYRITVDCGNFRQKREETLRELAKKLHRTVIKTGRSCTLEPMNPYERRIIHSVISELDGVYSRSIGDEPYRKIILSSKNSNYRNNKGQRKQSGKGQYNKDYNKGRTDFSREDRKTTIRSEEAIKRDKLSDDGTALYSKIEF